MKKLLGVIFIGLLVLSLSACKKQEEEIEVVGGWTTTDEELSAEVLEVFNSAVEGLTGASYEPIKLLGTQVVAGTNYRILCEQTLVTPEATKSQKVLTIYEALDGTCEIIEIEDYQE